VPNSISTSGKSAILVSPIFICETSKLPNPKSSSTRRYCSSPLISVYGRAAKGGKNLTSPITKGIEPNGSTWLEAPVIWLSLSRSSPCCTPGGLMGTRAFTRRNPPMAMPACRTAVPNAPSPASGGKYMEAISTATISTERRILLPPPCGTYTARTIVPGLGRTCAHIALGTTMPPIDSVTELSQSPTLSASVLPLSISAYSWSTLKGSGRIATLYMSVVPLYSTSPYWGCELLHAH